MIKIDYPNKKPEIRLNKNKEYIFCIVRKRWVIITPEEWVRQNFLLFLIEALRYPSSLIAVEKQLMVSEVKKRFDIVIYKNAAPFMIIECKEMNVTLTESTLRQVLYYNATIQANYMVVTNGSYCKAFEKVANDFLEIFELPNFT